MPVCTILTKQQTWNLRLSTATRQVPGGLPGYCREHLLPISYDFLRLDPSLYMTPAAPHVWRKMADVVAGTTIPGRLEQVLFFQALPEKPATDSFA